MPKIKQGTIIVSFLWLFFATFTFFAYYTGNDNFKWIDIPTHITAGIIIAAVIFKLKNHKPRKALLLAFLPFLGWEFFEIGASLISHNELIVALFHETAPNKIQDVSMDITGFLTFLIATKRKF